MVMEFFVHALDKGDDSIPNPHFHVMCPIRLLDEHGRWSNKQRGNIYWMKTESEDEAGNYVFNGVLTTNWGAALTLWNIGGKHGRICASLPRKGWMSALTTAVMTGRGLTHFLSSMWASLSGR